jgi:UPF0716 family protein affecting phage T7 exclusion
MQVGGIVTLVMIGSLVGVLLIGERMRKKREREAKHRANGTVPDAHARSGATLVKG